MGWKSPSNWLRKLPIGIDLPCGPPDYFDGMQRIRDPKVLRRLLVFVLISKSLMLAGYLTFVWYSFYRGWASTVDGFAVLLPGHAVVMLSIALSIWNLCTAYLRRMRQWLGQPKQLFHEIIALAEYDERHGFWQLVK